MLPVRPIITRVALSAAAMMVVCGRAEALDLGANGRISTGVQDNDGTEIDQDEQRVLVHLGQQFTPWFGVNLSYRFDRFVNELENGLDTERKTSQPQLDLFYNRPKFQGQLTFLSREIRGTFGTSDLDVDSILGEFHLVPDRGPRYSLRFRDNTNVADPGVFGRETRSLGAELDVVYRRSAWAAVYSYAYASVDNTSTGGGLDQGRHEARVNYSDRFVGNRLALGGEARVSRLSQDVRNVQGGTRVEPVPAREGLFAVDTTPDIATLDPEPGLIDGDIASPVIPPILIGGANTFRNIGVDLFFTRPATRLEVYVDAPSDPTLVWQVWASPDNLQWEVVPGSSSVFDSARLIYTIQFPLTTSRFFKAVNVSVNTLDNVNVTEIRALVESDPPDENIPDTTLYRLNFNANYAFSPRLSATAAFGYRSDRNIAAGFVGANRSEWNSVASFRYAIKPDLGLSSNYNHSQLSEDFGAVPLDRRTDNFNVLLDWTPLSSVKSIAGASHLEERSATEPIRTVDSIHARAGTQLFPDLWLNSELRYTRVDDPFNGFMQNSWTWRETINSRPARNWTLEGTVGFTKFDSRGRSNLTRRTVANIRTSWLPVPFINLLGEWNIGRDDQQRSLTQRYGFVWSPGSKLSTRLSYYIFEAKDRNKTSTASVSMTYAFLRGLDLFATINRSVFEQVGLPVSERTNFRIGINFIF